MRLEIVIHATLPPDRERWVGVVPDPGHKSFGDHCLIMNRRGEVVFDPGISLRPPRGTRLRVWRPSEIAYGISFDRQTRGN